MSPAPGTRHQMVLGELHRQMANHFADRDCAVFAAPTDIRLSKEDVVQPELLVVCEKDKIKPTHIDGSPTLVIEVLSPSTEAFDRVRKLRLYAANGIQEVWLITPYPSLVDVLTLDADSYRIAGVYGGDDTPVSAAFPDLQIDLSAVLNFPITPEERIRVVKESRSPYSTRKDAEQHPDRSE